MLEFIRPHLEAEAAQRGRQALLQLQAAQTRNKAYWVLHLFSWISGLIVLMIGLSVADRVQSWCTRITIVVVLLTVILVAVGEWQRSLRSALRLARWYLQFRQRVAQRLASDYLAAYAWATYLFVIVPGLSFLFLVILTSRGEWSLPNSVRHREFSDTLKQLMTLAGAVLAVQVALLNFMFGQLLGKYSSTIAAAVSQHRVVRLLRGFTIGVLVALYSSYCLGFPATMPRFTLLLLITILSTVVLTVGVATKGIEADSAMRYAGSHIGTLVARKLRPPIKGYTWFWKAVAAFGLDWRNPQRMVPTVVPNDPANSAIRMAAGIFNAAHRAAEDNQHEMFFASLEALRAIAERYADARSRYFGMGDSFFDYLINQLSSLLKAAAKSSNETLLTNAITYCRLIGSISLKLGAIETKEARNSDLTDYPKTHSYFVHWFGLLSEGFELGHTLTRSTAASESLTQMAILTNESVDSGYVESVQITFLPEMSRIHTKCLHIGDPYHMNLAGECLINVMKGWMHSSVNEGRAWAYVSKPMVETVQEMAALNQAVHKLPSLELLDAANVLVTKFDEDRYTLQDICLAILHRKHTESWEKRHAVEEVSSIIELLTALNASLTSNQWATAKSYVEAIYEIAILVFRGVPPAVTDFSLEEQKYTEMGEAPDRQQKLDDAVGAAFYALFEWLEREKWRVFSTEQTVFAGIGLSAAVYKTSSRKALRLSSLKCIEYYRDTIKALITSNENIGEDRWNYLQLCAAWCFALLNETTLGEELVKLVAINRPFRFGYLSGGSGRYGSLGFPSGDLGMDFFLPVPRNIAHYFGNDERKQLDGWRGLAMNEQMLLDTYARVEEIRKPLRDHALKRYRERETIRRKKKQPEQESSGPVLGANEGHDQ